MEFVVSPAFRAPKAVGVLPRARRSPGEDPVRKLQKNEEHFRNGRVNKGEG